MQTINQESGLSGQVDDADISGGRHGALKLQHIVDRLTTAGLEADDARTLMLLTIDGAMTASALAKRLGSSRASTYRVLGRLTETGYVMASSDHPTRFTAADFEEVLGNLIARQEARLDETRRLKEDLDDVVARLQKDRQGDQPDSLLRVLKGRAAIHLIADVMAKDASNSIRVVRTHGAGVLSGRVEAWLELPDVAAGRVRMEAIVRPGEAIPEPSDGRDVEIHRSEQAPAVALVIIDDRDAMMWVVRDPSGRIKADGDVAIWSNDASFAAAQVAWFQSMVRHSDVVVA